MIIVKEKKKTVNGKLIVVGSLIFVVVVLSILFVIQLTHSVYKEQITVHYINYDNRLVQVHYDGLISVTTNLYQNKRNLAVLLDSKESSNKRVKVSVAIKKEDDTELFQKEEIVPILHHTKAISTFELPELNGESLKSIDVTITEEEIDVTTDIVANPVTSSVQEEVLENKETNVSVTWTPTKEFNQGMGAIVLYQNDKIVEVSTFVREKEQTTFTTNSTFPNQLKNNELVPIEHDRVEAFISYYE